MPPTKRDQMAFMAMMEDMMHNHLPPCPADCPGCNLGTKACQTLSKHLSEFTKHAKNSPHFQAAAKISAHTHAHHNHTHTHTHTHECGVPPKERPARKATPQPDKENVKPSADKSTPETRDDKIQTLIEAASQKEVLEVLNLTKISAQENDFIQQMQVVLADSKNYNETRSKILALAAENDTPREVLAGLLSKYRYDRSLLTSAVLKSNTEREKYLLAIKRVDQLMAMLKDMGKTQKKPSEGDIGNSLSNIMLEINELAISPCSMYEDIQSIKDENDELYAESEDTRQELEEFRSCHDKLHEKHKKLESEKLDMMKELAEVKKRTSLLSGSKNDANNLRKALDKSREDNLALQKNVERLTAELGKVNSLKHENTQLKKKLAAADAAREQSVPTPEPTPEPSTAKKKKAMKKSTAVPETPESEPVNAPTIEYRPDPALLKELETLKTVHVTSTRQLEAAHAKLRQADAMLQKVEKAKTHAIEQQNIEKATSENWKELSEGHKEECQRLQEQLEQSLSNATTLQEKVHELERSTSELSEKLQSQTEKRPTSPSAESQTSSKLDADSTRALRRLRAETAQLVRDLDDSFNFPAMDPWSVVGSTRRMVANMEMELEDVLRVRASSDGASDPFVPYRYADGRMTPSLPRMVDSPLMTPSLPSISTPFKPMIPPGLGPIPFNRPNQTQNLPTPIGTGRPQNGQKVRENTSSPAVPHVTPIAKVNGSTNGLGKGIGNGAAGVDWSMWAKSQT